MPQNCGVSKKFGSILNYGNIFNSKHGKATLRSRAPFLNASEACMM